MDRISSSNDVRQDNDALFPVLDHEGRLFYAFIEVCDKVFTGIPRQTIKSRMRNLGLTLVQCPGDIQDSVRKARPYLASFRVISLISKRDVNILQAYQESRMQSERPLSRKCIDVGDSAFSKVERGFSRENTCNSSALSYRRVTSLNSPVAATSNFSIDHILETGQTATNSSSTHVGPARVESSSEDEGTDADFESVEEESSNSDSSVESNDGDCLQQEESQIVRMFKKRKLDPSAFRDVIRSVSEMKAFYLAEFNHKRRSPRMTESTWSKHLERLIVFLAYCVTTLKLKPALSLVDDLVIVEGFVNYLKKNRRVQNSTAARYLHSLLTAAKFIHADDSRSDYEQVASVSDIRSLRNQLEKAHRLTRRAPSVKLLWPQFQEVVRSLHCKYEEASGLARARLHMNFTMLLLFAVNPGRAKELRTLRLLTERRGEHGIQELVKDFPEGENAVIFSCEGPVWLIEHGYKTASKYGPSVVRFDTAEYQFVTFHLQEYKGVSRPRLLSEDKHDYFFVNKRGTQFKSSGSFSRYLSRIFQEHLGFPCAINEMRHSLVEHFRSSPESSDIRLAESLARVCKHSLRTQINIYDRRTETERRSQALSYLNRSAVNFILDEPPSSPTDDSDREADDLPSPGEMCALVPSDASQKDPAVFLAKVLKYTADGKSARLAWFKEIATRPTFYEFQTGSDVWEEKTSSLIYPVDVVFHRQDGTYELRTPKERLCSLVKK